MQPDLYTGGAMLVQEINLTLFIPYGSYEPKENP